MTIEIKIISPTAEDALAELRTLATGTFVPRVDDSNRTVDTTVNEPVGLEREAWAKLHAAEQATMAGAKVAPPSERWFNTETGDLRETDGSLHQIADMPTDVVREPEPAVVEPQPRRRGRPPKASVEVAPVAANPTAPAVEPEETTSGTVTVKEPAPGAPEPKTEAPGSVTRAQLFGGFRSLLETWTEVIGDTTEGHIVANQCVIVFLNALPGYPSRVREIPEKQWGATLAAIEAEKKRVKALSKAEIQKAKIEVQETMARE